MKIKFDYFVRAFVLVLLFSGCKPPKDDMLEPIEGTVEPVLIWKKKLQYADQIIEGDGENIILKRLAAIDKQTGDLKWAASGAYTYATYSRRRDNVLIFQDIGLHEDYGGLIDLDNGNILWTYNFGNPQVSLYYPATCPNAEGIGYFCKDNFLSKFDINTNTSTPVEAVNNAGLYGIPYTFINDQGNTKLLYNLKNGGVLLWDVNSQSIAWVNKNFDISQRFSFTYNSGNIFLASIDSIYKLSEYNGETLWGTKLVEPSTNFPYLKSTVDHVYLQNSTTLQCFYTLTGQKIWEKPIVLERIQLKNNWFLGIQKQPVKFLIAYKLPSLKVTAWKISADTGMVTSYYLDSAQKRVYLTDSDAYLYCYEIP